MIKLIIERGEKDSANKVFIFEEGKKEEKEVLTFEVIKKYSKQLLYAKVNDDDISYQISTNDNLQQYKETVEKVFKSVLEDIELQEIYKDSLKGNK